MKASLKKDFTPDEIVALLLTLGSADYRRGSRGEYIFQTVCHNEANGSYKLYYYPDSNLFHCYTECGTSFDVYELVQRAKHCEFYEAYSFICNYFGISAKFNRGFEPSDELEDWDVIRRYQPMKSKYQKDKLVPLEKNLLELYPRATPLEWINEGISVAAMEKFDIRFSLAENKIIIPDFDINGNLVGIRGRALNPDEAARAKYCPVTIGDETLNYPTSLNLYGAWKNLDTIRRTKKILLCEGEKSVLKCETFYPDNNFAVAVCGSNIDVAQRDIILNLGVREVFIAFDREYQTLPSQESEAYGNKLIKLAHMFSPFVTVYVLWDEHDYLAYKDAPVDKGQGVFESLMKEKIEIQTTKEEPLGRKKRK